MNKINSILYKYSKIYDNNRIGIKGQINDSVFVDINDNNSLLSDYCNYNDNNDEEISEDELKTNNIYIIWDNYRNAMDRKRPGNSLNLCGFYGYITDGATVFKYKNSYVLGLFSNGFYKPSHFAPSSIREGMEMIEELCKYNNIIFTVTSDLTQMLTKLGAYTDSSFNFPMIFRNEISFKNIVTTNKRVLEVILKKMKNNEIDDLYNLNFDDIIDKNKKEDKYDKYLKNYDKYGSVYESIIIEEYNKIISEDDYKGWHKAPKRTDDVGSPLYDVREIFGKDIYDHSSKELAKYGSGHSYDQLLASMILSYKDKPNKTIKIYRAIPDFNKEYKDKIKDLKMILSYYNKFKFYPPRNKYKKYADIVDQYENIIKNENNNIEYNELKYIIYNRIVNEISEIDSKKQKYIIEKGDWVTIIKEYAIEHGKTQFDNYIILSKTVKASEIFTEGYMEEWGYDPIKSINESNQNDETESDIQALVDIIDIDPNSAKMERYKKTLKDKYNYEYIPKEIREKKNIKIVKNLINKKHNKKTNKGFEFYFITKKHKIIPTIIVISIYNKDNNKIGRAGFNINTQEKSILIGGVYIEEEYRRKGIYSSIVDYIENVANIYNLKIVEGSRSSDAKAFWNDRNNI